MIPDRDFCPRGNKTFGDGAAKPLGAAGDHGAAVVEIDFVHGEILSLRSCHRCHDAGSLLPRPALRGERAGVRGSRRPASVSGAEISCFRPPPPTSLCSTFLLL